MANDTVQSIAALIEALSVLGALIFAIWGVNAWRKQIIGQRRIDLAESILLAVFRAKDAFDDIRSPFSQIGEDEIDRFVRDHKLEKGQAITAALYFNRIERVNSYKEVFEQLRELSYKRRVTFNLHDMKYAEAFFQARAEVIGAARDAIEALLHGDQIDSEEEKRIRSALYRKHDLSDKISVSIEKIVKDASLEFSPILKL